MGTVEGILNVFNPNATSCLRGRLRCADLHLGLPCPCSIVSSMRKLVGRWRSKLPSWLLPAICFQNHLWRDSPGVPKPWSLKSSDHKLVAGFGYCSWESPLPGTRLGQRSQLRFPALPLPLPLPSCAPQAPSWQTVEPRLGEKHPIWQLCAEINDKNNFP